MSGKIEVGSRVAFSANWLRSMGIYSGVVPFLRGTVIEIEVVTHEFHLATVKWDGEPRLAKVNIANLALVGSPEMNAN